MHILVQATCGKQSIVDLLGNLVSVVKEEDGDQRINAIEVATAIHVGMSRLEVAESLKVPLLSEKRIWDVCSTCANACVDTMKSLLRFLTQYVKSNSERRILMIKMLNSVKINSKQMNLLRLYAKENNYNIPKSYLLSYLEAAVQENDSNLAIDTFQEFVTCDKSETNRDQSNTNNEDIPQASEILSHFVRLLIHSSVSMAWEVTEYMKDHNFTLDPQVKRLYEDTVGNFYSSDVDYRPTSQDETEMEPSDVVKKLTSGVKEIMRLRRENLVHDTLLDAIDAKEDSPFINSEDSTDNFVGIISHIEDEGSVQDYILQKLLDRLQKIREKSKKDKAYGHWKRARVISKTVSGFQANDSVKRSAENAENAALGMNAARQRFGGLARHVLMTNAVFTGPMARDMVVSEALKLGVSEEIAKTAGSLAYEVAEDARARGLPIEEVIKRAKNVVQQLVPALNAVWAMQQPSLSEDEIDEAGDVEGKIHCLS